MKSRAQIMKEFRKKSLISQEASNCFLIFIKSIMLLFLSLQVLMVITKFIKNYANFHYFLYKFKYHRRVFHFEPMRQLFGYFKETIHYFEFDARNRKQQFIAKLTFSLHKIQKKKFIARLIINCRTSYKSFVQNNVQRFEKVIQNLQQKW